MAILDQLKAKAITTAVDMAIDLLYEDFDGGLPKVRSALNRFVGSATRPTTSSCVSSTW